MTSELEILSIGHSVHSWQRFAELLHASNVTAIADVRSSPFSKHTPHFSMRELKEALRSEGIAYSFLGKELGGRPKHANLYAGGIADYEAMAKTPEVRAGVARVLDGSRQYRIALLCSEHNPLDCHRCLLVARHLAQTEVGVKHILSDGQVVSHAEIEDRLLQTTSLSRDDFFMTRHDRLHAAYQERSKKVAYAEASLQERTGAAKQR